MINKNIINQMINDLENATFHIGDSDALIAAEEHHRFLKSYIDGKITDEEFVDYMKAEQIGDALSCPPESDECVRYEPGGRCDCNACWILYLGRDDSNEELQNG